MQACLDRKRHTGEGEAPLGGHKEQLEDRQAEQALAHVVAERVESDHARRRNPGTSQDLAACLGARVDHRLVVGGDHQRIALGCSRQVEFAVFDDGADGTIEEVPGVAAGQRKARNRKNPVLTDGLRIDPRIDDLFGQREHTQALGGDGGMTHPGTDRTIQHIGRREGRDINERSEIVFVERNFSRKRAHIQPVGGTDHHRAAAGDRDIVQFSDHRAGDMIFDRAARGKESSIVGRLNAYAMDRA